MALTISSEEFTKFIDGSRSKTISYLRKHYSALRDEDIDDVYQDSSIALWQNLVDGKVSDMTSSLYTYFLRICINQALKALSKQGPTISIEDPSLRGIQQDDDYKDDKINEVLDLIDEIDDDPSVGSRAAMLVRAIMGELKEKCRDLLWGFHGDNLSWTTLADMYDIKNADTAKQEASRCRKSFKEKYAELFEKYNND